MTDKVTLFAENRDTMPLRHKTHAATVQQQKQNSNQHEDRV